MSLEKSTPYRNAWYRDLLEKEAELKQYTDEKVAQAIELPEVTSEDNGDLLAADDGSWVKSDKLKTIMNAGVEEVGKIPMVGATGEWGLTDYPTNELPSVTSADNGKVAGVVDGNWNTMDIPNELPPVTGADDGKVLGVSSGAWGLIEQARGVMLFTCTSASTPTLDNGKTIADVNEAFSNGYVVVVKKGNMDYIMLRIGSGNIPILISLGFDDIIYTRSIFFLIGNSPNSNSFSIYPSICLAPPRTSGKTVISTSSGWIEGDFPKELPTVSSADNGSVLKVVNGQWAVGQVASSPIPISSSNSINAITVEGSLL